MSNERNGPCGKLQQTIKSQDLFAVPVQLTYKGERAFNTFCGGCISVILIPILIAYSIFGFYDAYEHPNYQ